MSSGAISAKLHHPLLITQLHTLSPSLYSLTSFTSTRTSNVNHHKFRPLVTTTSTSFNVKAMAKRSSARFNDDLVASSADLQFESPLKIVAYPDPKLRAKNKKIVTFDDDLKKLVDEMFDVMYKTDGIGLSAPQVGVNVQLMVFNPTGEREEGEEIVLINPRVNRRSLKTTIFNEGCLSFPGIYGDVKRPKSIKIDAKDIKGARFSITLSDLPARIFQHEFDHLQGKLFFERMTEEVLDSIRLELQALETKYEANTGLQSPEKIDTTKRRETAVGSGMT